MESISSKIPLVLAAEAIRLPSSILQSGRFAARNQFNNYRDLETTIPLEHCPSSRQAIEEIQDVYSSQLNEALISSVQFVMAYHSFNGDGSEEVRSGVVEFVGTCIPSNVINYIRYPLTTITNFLDLSL